MSNFYDELLVELECPICMTYMAPPIRQCATGHSICEPCRMKLPMCPLCQGKFTDSKNISLEALARKMHYPCVNYKVGCQERLSLNEREDHERVCSYKGYRCPFTKCNWIGRYEDILDHWIQKKLANRPYRESNVCHVKVQKTESLFINLVEAHDQIFWYKFKTSGGKMYWSIQYIGASDKANDYYFEIELFKPGQPCRRTLMSEFCQPLEIDNKELFKSGSGVITTVEASNHFFGEDQLLIFYMRVKQYKEDTKRSGRDASVSRKNQSGGHHDPRKGNQNEPQNSFQQRKTIFKPYSNAKNKNNNKNDPK